MTLGKISFPEKILLTGLLVAGAIIFSFPFLWMISTSVKLRREMSSEKMEQLNLIPQTPRPQSTSPYVATDHYDEPTRPDGIPDAVWETALPRLEKDLGRILDAWNPQTPGPEGNPPPGEVRGEDFHREMTDGLLYTLRSRIHDDARRAALVHEKELRTRDGRLPLPRDSELTKELSPQAVQFGTDQLAADASRLVDEKMLRETFEACYRRLALGQVRIRTTDFTFHSLFTGTEWRVVDGPAELVARSERVSRIQELRYRFEPGNETVTVEFTCELPEIDASGTRLSPDQIDRVYVGIRADDTWAKMDTEVVRGDTIYRPEKKGVLADLYSYEMELRWEENLNPMVRRIYTLLEPEGDAPPDSPEFAIRLTIQKTTQAIAWYDKITRNYLSAFAQVNFLRYIMTSFSLAILNIVLAIFSCTLTAYAFARLEWPGRDLCFGILLATMMLPGQVTMIPGFLVIKHLGWYNTLLPMWVPAGFGSAFFIFLLRQFFKNIPKDLEDAARIDGCGFLRIYWHVMLPLVKPTIAVIAIFTFMGVWNNFMGPLIYINDERLFPLALGLFKFSLQGGADVCLMMAGSFIMTSPIIVLFFFVQRYFIQGVSLTGMKG